MAGHSSSESLPERAHAPRPRVFQRSQSQSRASSPSASMSALPERSSFIDIPRSSRANRPSMDLGPGGSLPSSFPQASSTLLSPLNTSPHTRLGHRLSHSGRLSLDLGILSSPSSQIWQPRQRRSRPSHSSAGSSRQHHTSSHHSSRSRSSHHSSYSNPARHLRSPASPASQVFSQSDRSALDTDSDNSRSHSFLTFESQTPITYLAETLCHEAACTVSHSHSAMCIAWAICDVVSELQESQSSALGERENDELNEGLHDLIQEAQVVIVACQASLSPDSIWEWKKTQKKFYSLYIKICNLTTQDLSDWESVELFDQASFLSSILVQSEIICKRLAKDNIMDMIDVNYLLEWIQHVKLVKEIQHDDQVDRQNLLLFLLDSTFCLYVVVEELDSEIYQRVQAQSYRSPYSHGLLRPGSLEQTPQDVQLSEKSKKQQIATLLPYQFFTKSQNDKLETTM